ncbi:MAG: HNH endonuclease, partial [Gammaproteobacteria bacterium]|nr:HNH endonuclease [Gammaproteobacteria bacterium]
PNRTIEIDHANRNRLDNRKENLRQCTPSQNKWNIGKRGNNTSGYKGVCWKKDKQKWVACIRKDHKVTWLGHFKDKIKAAKAYDKAALELHGQFAVLNF